MAFIYFFGKLHIFITDGRAIYPQVEISLILFIPAMAGASKSTVRLLPILTNRGVHLSLPYTIGYRILVQLIVKPPWLEGQINNEMPVAQITGGSSDLNDRGAIIKYSWFVV